MNVIVDTPAEFLPYLLFLAIVTTFIFGYVKAIPAYNDKNKELLRNGTIVEKFKYGMDYLISDAVGFVTVLVFAIIVPGIVYVAYFGTEPDLAGCLVITFIISAIGGYGGVAVLHRIIDSFRDRAKIADLEKKERINQRWGGAWGSPARPPHPLNPMTGILWLPPHCEVVFHNRGGTMFYIVKQK